ncbi:MAG: 30S ribosomal protein S20 [FCB group bacterium]|nr:30S ribosomal protein S20 [FCB group bacterium]
MDRHPQQIKRTRQDLKRRERNIRNLSEMKTLMKKVMDSTDLKTAEPVYKETISFLDKMSHSGLIHKNTAARRKAQITRYINTLA